MTVDQESGKRRGPAARRQPLSAEKKSMENNLKDLVNKPCPVMPKTGRRPLALGGLGAIKWAICLRRSAKNHC